MFIHRYLDLIIYIPKKYINHNKFKFEAKRNLLHFEIFLLDILYNLLY